jgi:hypothetical protein
MERERVENARRVRTAETGFSEVQLGSDDGWGSTLIGQER